MDDHLKIVIGKLSLGEAVKALERVKQKRRPISLRGKEGREYLRQRMVWARSFVFLEKFKNEGVGVSMWEVMKQARARKPWADSKDKDVVIEAARRLGMDVVEEKNTILFR